MSGRKENHPLWKRATSQIEGLMGEALGKIYVERYFPASSKERMEKLVKNLQISLAERINAQDWMSAETKKAALDKLNSFYVKIGYPNKWKDMSGLTIDPKLSYYENVMNCREYWAKWDIDYRAGKPVDKDEWFMTPQTVNAYYNPTTNEICFPAGILQVPFFDPEVITRIRSRPGNTKAGIGSFRLQIFPVDIFVTRPPEIGIFQVDCLIAKPNDPVGFEGEALRKFERVQER